MLIAMVLFLYVPAVLFEWFTVLRHAEKKLKILHSSMMLISFCALILYSLHVSLPSPNDMIMDVLEPILKLKG